MHQPMSALPPIADICGAQAHVCFVPIADMSQGFTFLRLWVKSERRGLMRSRSACHAGVTPELPDQYLAAWFRGL